MSELQGGEIEPPGARLAELRSWHAPDLSWRQKQVVTALELGYTVGETAALMRRTDATVRRHIAGAQARIFHAHDIEPHHGLIAKWAREHFACCLQPSTGELSHRSSWARRLQRPQSRQAHWWSYSPRPDHQPRPLQLPRPIRRPLHIQRLRMGLDGKLRPT